MEDEEKAAEAELLAMSKEQLLLVDHDKIKWGCCILGCNHHTHIKDFGILPKAYTRWGWLDLTENVYICGKHWKPYKKNPDQFEYKYRTGDHHLIFD